MKRRTVDIVQNPSKSCKAIHQENRTGQYRRHIRRVSDSDGNFQMSAEELSYGGYGDADWNTPFGDGKY